MDSPNINYYFLLILVAAAIVSIGFYTYHRRRKLLKEAARGTDPRAAGRDVNGWAEEGGRRRWRPVGLHGPGGARRAEGLDERGEAPPPYKPSDEENSPASAHNDGNFVSVPLQTLSRSDAGLRPPGYEEAVQSSPASPRMEAGLAPISATVDSMSNPPPDVHPINR